MPVSSSSHPARHASARRASSLTGLTLAGSSLAGSSLALILAVFALLALAPASALAQGAAESHAQIGGTGFADLVERVAPAVVAITTTKEIGNERARPPGMPDLPPGSPFEEFFEEFMRRQPQQMPREATSLGSGFVIDAQRGYIVTNNHVVAKAEEITVVLDSGNTIEADLVGTDAKTDIAVLRVDTDLDLTEVEFGNSRDMRVGDWVVAIGNPFGLGGTVTAGIISARARDINAGPYDDFFQTDASINRGNSGGPMFNTEGKVIGINTAIFSPTQVSIGIGFAIPSDLARPVIDQLIEYGETRRGWLGVRIQTVTPEIAESLGLDSAAGALVASVNEGGPARKGGIEPGDVILRFDGRKVEEMRDLPRMVAETPVGEEVGVVLWRDGERLTRKVTLGRLERAEQAGLVGGGAGGERPERDENGAAPAGPLAELFTHWGVELAELDGGLRAELEIPAGIDGLVITSVTPDGKAAARGLSPGAVITEINGQPLTRLETLQDQVAAAREKGRGAVLLRVNDRGDVGFRTLPLPGAGDE